MDERGLGIEIALAILYQSIKFMRSEAIHPKVSQMAPIGYHHIRREENISDAIFYQSSKNLEKVEQLTSYFTKQEVKYLLLLSATIKWADSDSNNL